MMEESEEFNLQDDEELDESAHKKLLNAVSQIYKKQRIAAPKRNEPSQQISEFNLSKSDQKRKIGASDLVQALNKKVTLHQISQRVKNIQDKVKRLPKPLEKFQAEKISRQMGYNAIKTDLWKWEPVIQKNRAADQLVFPLKDTQITFERDSNFLNTFSKPSDLELKMAEMLKVSLKCEEGKEDVDYDKLTLEEVLKRRRTVAKMRARESYRIAKAVRQNKIKSKKYHRLLKRDRIKQELKEFELLQKTDPDAALAKLERIEKARAEERISLRHRNTGKWAKGLALRAKYDDEARAQLEENLRKSRQLTQKNKASIDTDSEADEDDDSDILPPEPNASANPWIGDQSDEITSFVSGYRKFWGEQNQKTSEKENQISEEKSNPPRDEKLDENSSNDHSERTSEPTKDDSENIGSSEDSDVESACKESVSGSDMENNSDSIDKADSTGEPEQSVMNENGASKSNDLANDEKMSSDDVSDETNGDNDVNCIQNIWQNIVENAFNVTLSKNETKTTANTKCCSPSSNFKIEKITNKSTKNDRTESVKNHSPNSLGDKSKWFVSEDNVKSKLSRKKLNKEIQSVTEEEFVVKKRKIENLFERVEDSISEAVPKRIATMEKRLKNQRDKSSVVFKESPSSVGVPKHLDLSFKKTRLGQIDDSLIETTENGISSGRNDMKSFMERLKESVKKTESSDTNLPDIDPGKFIPVKTQKLKTAISCLEEAGDSETDDEGEGNERQHLNLMEAFADDDIADEFQREKEEEEEESKPKEIDLSLPGWGNWGGAGLAAKNRKNKRILKFPRVKRKDDNKKTVIINEDVFNKFRALQPTDLPPQISNVASYEAMIRAPIGDTFVPQTAHNAFIAPRIITKLGQIIEPMDKSVLLEIEEKEGKESSGKNKLKSLAKKRGNTKKTKTTKIEDKKIVKGKNGKGDKSLVSKKTISKVKKSNVSKPNQN